MSFLDSLNWRYATKVFDTNKKLSAEQLHLVTESLRLSPSSFGLQPWKFVVVSDPALRVKLREAAWGQAQVTDASHLIVLCTLNTLDTAYIDRFVDFIVQENGAPREALQGYRDMMVGSISPLNPEQLQAWMQKQVYIALGVALSACAVNQIDAAPMEGFDKNKFDEILGLNALGIKSAVLCAVGFRSDTDSNAQQQKVRWPENEVIMGK
ncbi:MAG: NAD(P)H-dependent oxidoreductase [Candidatus Abawacabacteria bacterium]|nr:NAD(P)H-dependent oxidoreductase [Candidatus Abawacabacteria bacterium]